MTPRDPDRSHDPNDPARKPSDDPRAAGPATGDPNQGNDGGNDPDDIIPHSAKDIDDYHYAIQDGADAFNGYHGPLHEAMTRRHKAQEHPEITPAFAKCLAEHAKEIQRHNDWATEFTKNLADLFDKHHSALGKLSDGTEEHSSKSPEAEKGIGEGKAIEPPAPEVPVEIKNEPPLETKAAEVTTPESPVETKTAEDELSEAQSLLLAEMIKNFRQEFRQDVEQMGKRLDHELVGAK